MVGHCCEHHRLWVTILVRLRFARKFVSMRHNTIRDFTARLLSAICRDVKIEPLLQILEDTEEKTDQSF